MTYETATPRDVVYCGERTTSSEKIGAQIALMNPDGTVEKTMTFAIKKSPLSIIGGIYTGVRFEDTQCFGLSVAKWTGQRHPNRELVATWEAEEIQDERERNMRRKADEAAKDSTFDSLTIAEVRAMWTKAQKRGDWMTAAAIANTAAARVTKFATKQEIEAFDARR